MAKVKVKLGDKVRDKVTGFEGIAVARTKWLTGCDRITIESTALKDGKPIGLETFDEDRVEQVNEGEYKGLSKPKSKKPGGPRPDPVTR